MLSVAENTGKGKCFYWPLLLCNLEVRVAEIDGTITVCAINKNLILPGWRRISIIC